MLVCLQRDADGAAWRSVHVGVEAAGDARRPDAHQAHAARADLHQDVAQDAAAGEEQEETVLFYYGRRNKVESPHNGPSAKLVLKGNC